MKYSSKFWCFDCRRNEMETRVAYGRSIDFS